MQIEGRCRLTEVKVARRSLDGSRILSGFGIFDGSGILDESRILVVSKDLAQDEQNSRHT
jgi:hypothetical protein